MKTIIILIISLPLLTLVSGRMISRLLTQSSLKSGQGTSPSMGRKIGYAERILIFIFVLLGCYEALGFLLAAKSILRFSESKSDKGYAEYVLYGTLLSTLAALSIGLGAKQLINTP